MKIADGWKDYEILQTGGGLKLERWKSVYLLRPDPQIVWASSTDMHAFDKLNAHYIRSSEGGGCWEIVKPFVSEWTIGYGDYHFLVKPSGFKHTGLFPEQAVNWDAMSALIRSANRPITVLNLFGYTGAATVACAHAGATVTHVDASKSMTERCKQNCALNGIPHERTRYIVDDCAKFVARERRRGKRYDAILMDPPSYGRGPGGELWKLEDGLFELVQNTAHLLSDDPLFFLINSYTTGLQPSVLGNILSLTVPSGDIDCYELCLPTAQIPIVLPCGSSGFWRAK